MFPTGFIQPSLMFVGRIMNVHACPGKPFQASLVFADKARAYLSEAPFRCSTLGTFLVLPTNIRLG